VMTDEDYEAELKARTPEQWAAMKENSLVDAGDIEALHHLCWRRDVKDQESLIKQAKKPGGMTLEDLDYFCHRLGEIADTLRPLATTLKSGNGTAGIGSYLPPP
jgi:hypothetical protein